jgi:hypothetical protein
MLQEVASRGTYRRVRELSARIERLASHKWHVTVTMMQPGSSVIDDTFPVVDLGIFPTTEEASDAADMVLENWAWA